MSSSNWTAQHPLRLLNEENGLPESEASILLARSGDGKSAALINFALYEMMKGGSVWHFCSESNSDKVHEYYQEIYSDLIRTHWDAEPDDWGRLALSLTVVSYPQPERMTQALEAEIATLNEGTKTAPALVLVDGMDLGSYTEAGLESISRTAREKGIRILVSLRVHRGENGQMEWQEPLALCHKYSRRVYHLDGAAEQARIFVSDPAGDRELPFYLCPHELIFKARS